MPSIRVGQADEIAEGTQRFVQVDGRGVYVTRVDGAFYASESACPCPLSGGTLNRVAREREAPCVECDASCYTLAFDLRTGRNTRDWNFEIQTYPVCIMDGDVIINY